MMKRTILIVSGIGIAAAASIAWLTHHGTAKVTYRTATVTRGNVSQTVASTGILSAVSTVSVGTQVSGQISKLSADFNDTVRAGQVIAQLDPTPWQQAVTQAQSDLAKAQADATQKQFLKAQADSLQAHGFITDTDWHAAQYNLTESQASLISARAALQRAQLNLRYTTIKAPISGVVIERDVDVGQTVAASLQAPQLFIIAEDLKQMQILVSVDESDIGQIKEGQTARFTVQTYGNRSFNGIVHQVRLQSKTTENVVNYTVVVSVNNPDGALLPGMTATVEFQTQTSANVLTVPNAALRFTPPASVLSTLPPNSAADSTAAGARRAAGAAATDAPGGNGGGPGRGAAGGRGGAGTARRSGTRAAAAELWYIGADGKPVSMHVRTGITDGQRTEVSGPPELKEGLVVLDGIVTGTAGASATPTANPFQPATTRGGRGP
ncbi:MAG TPA: efflux RND transporter periplasmic adaptor subunit [Gemmatimonadales bacterium]|jgi:HlyD family secretion protein